MTERLLYQDLIPYDVATSLDELRGPATGSIELPLTIHWGPQRVFDLGRPRQVESAYQAIVREGTHEVQEELLNRELLLRVWSDLALPERCRRAWEERYPALAA